MYDFTMTALGVFLLLSDAKDGEASRNATVQKTAKMVVLIQTYNTKTGGASCRPPQSYSDRLMNSAKKFLKMLVACRTFVSTTESSHCYPVALIN